MAVKKSWIVGGVAAIAVLWGVATYNRLASLREGIPAAWSQVATVMQRRFDLIPNLVATVKGYAKHEKELLTEVTKLRSQWGAASTPADRAKIGGQLDGALGRLLMVAESYPQLKASESFLK